MTPIVFAVGRHTPLETSPFSQGKMPNVRRPMAQHTFMHVLHNVPKVPPNLRLSCHHEPALKGLLRNCKTKGRRL